MPKRLEPNDIVLTIRRLADRLYALERVAAKGAGGGDGSVAVHSFVGPKHSASGLTVGQTVVATGAATFAWDQLDHDQLGAIGPDDHHARDHSIIGGTHTGFPGGTSDYLRADGTFATPPGGGGGTGSRAFAYFSG